MAFQQPARQPCQRLIRHETLEREPQTIAAPLSSADDEPQTWVLFSPPTDAATTTSYLSSAAESRPTPGRSILSDLGSLNTVARSAPSNTVLESPFQGLPSTQEDEGAVEDDAELDSLDGHLPDFCATPGLRSAREITNTATVLPRHDGLGSFRLQTQGIGPELQEQLYAFEQFNPNRARQPQGSLSLGQLERQQETEHEAARNRRIEAWRLEQSHYLLERIWTETKQRRRSETPTYDNNISNKPIAEEAPSMGVLGEAGHDTSANADDWHEQDATRPVVQQDGLCSRITRKMIRDLMGIDDTLLCIIFGEALPDGVVADHEFASAPKATSALGATLGPAAHGAESCDDGSTWQAHILECIARELGLLMHRVSTHPGAFSAYARMQQAPIPYAGLPAIAETPCESNEPPVDFSAQRSMPSALDFQPTVGQRTQPVAAPEIQSPDRPADTRRPVAGEASAPGTVFTRQEWEQDLDIKLVFRYLRSRFTSSRPSSPSPTSGTPHLATSSTQDVAAKAARVRQHHPLIAHQRARPAERRPFKATIPASPVALRHPSGSCASQSTRRSARRSSVSSRHSSRHYWDIGGSIGTGSMIANAGPMGSWGEV